MNYNRFIEDVKGRIDELSMGAVCVRIQCTQKNNGVMKRGLSFFEEGNPVAPTIYLENYYEEFLQAINCFVGFEEIKNIYKEERISEIAEELLHLYQDVRVEANGREDLLSDFSYVKNKVICRLINYEKNEEMLKEMPHERYLDLAIVYSVLWEEWGDDEKQLALMHVKNEHLKTWGVDKSELESEAMKNTKNFAPPDIRSLEEVLQSMMGESVCQTISNLYVLSNKHYRYGATALLYPGLLEEIGRYFDSDFYVLPSSIHEVIVLPCDVSSTMNIENLQSMVSEINRTQVEVEDVLSDHVYRYQRDRRALTF